MVINAERQGRLYDPRMPEAQLVPFLLDLHGPELLRDASIRERLLGSATDAELKELFAYNGDAAPPRGRKAAERIIANRRWHPGKSWPAFFVKTLGLPLALGGSPDGGAMPAFEDIDPYVPLPPLHDYQELLSREVVETLSAPPGHNRAILSLPTGAGKTRTVVHAVMSEYHGGKRFGQFMLWIAQSDELCEQALVSFREVWTDMCVRSSLSGQIRGESLRLFRMWSTRPYPDPCEHGVVIASIQKLDNMFRSPSADVSDFIDRIGLVIIDEAHHAIASSYTGVFRSLGLVVKRPEDSVRPMIGLTATPYRGSEAERGQLRRRFFDRLLIPGWDNPMTTLREMGILARMSTEPLATGRTYCLTDAEIEKVTQFKDLPSSALTRIGDDHTRNAMILQRLLAIEPDWPVLLFGCSVEHATSLALLLRRAGRLAAVVTGDTPRALRRQRIEDFREGRLQFLCNFGVLTTGFDAPKVRAVVVARPTSSVLLYEQMVGRGMRGRMNGGTDECLVIDMVDAIPQFGGLMSYQRYADMWAKKGQA
jgi:superfamily II DNA or RNA helicase